MVRSMHDGGVLCRYFFQTMMVEDDTAPSSLEQHMSSLLLSSEPTLDELRRKFPFEGQYHFRLQHPLPAPNGKSSYCWLDLSEPNHVLPVMKSPHAEIRVKVLQLSHELAALSSSSSAVEKEKAHLHADQVDVPEDRQFDAYFRSQQPHKNRSNEGGGYSSQQQYPQQQQHHQQQDVSSVLSGVKKALASKMKQSAMAQSIQKQSAKMWEKVVSGGGASGSSGNAPPTAAALAQLAKLVGAMKAPLHESNRDHVDFLNRLWVTCFDSQPFTLRGGGWDRLGFNYSDPIRELQFVLPLHCLVFFHEVHRNVALPMLNDQSVADPESYPYALVGAQVAFLVADLLQLKDGGCLGSERPFWRLFEDPIAFFELFSIAFRAFDQSWKMNANKVSEIGFHLNYVAEFSQELLRRSPETVPALVGFAYQMQNW